MATLKSNELLALMQATQDIYACRDHTYFARIAVASITRLISADRADLQLYQSTDGVETLYCDHPLPGDDDREIWFKEHMMDHPIVAHAVAHNDLGPHMLCDFVSQREWRRSEFYAVCCREPADNFLLCGAAKVESQRELSISLVRQVAGFNERDRLVMKLIQSHLVQAWDNLQYATGLDQQVEWLERGMETSGRAAIVIDDLGRVQIMSPKAVDLLQRHFPNWRGPRLPLPLDEWLGDQPWTLRAKKGHEDLRRKGHGSKVGDLPPASPLAISLRLRLQSNEGELIARVYPACDGRGQPAILSLEENSLEADLKKLKSLGLTPRQTQTLYWMSHGKSNQEIASILSVRPRTVDKFVEDIFRRLKVCNRLDAAMLARGVLAESVH